MCFVLTEKFTVNVPENLQIAYQIDVKWSREIVLF